MPTNTAARHPTAARMVVLLFTHMVSTSHIAHRDASPTMARRACLITPASDAEPRIRPNGPVCQAADRALIRFRVGPSAPGGMTGGPAGRKAQEIRGHHPETDQSRLRHPSLAPPVACSGRSSRARQTAATCCRKTKNRTRTYRLPDQSKEPDAVRYWSCPGTLLRLFP